LAHFFIGAFSRKSFSCSIRQDLFRKLRLDLSPSETFHKTKALGKSLIGRFCIIAAYAHLLLSTLNMERILIATP
jgi:hypothetical protein